MSPAQRADGLQKLILFFADGIVLAARLVKVMDENDEVIPSFIPARFVDNLRRIADGRLLPEVMVRYREDMDLRDRVGRLPLIEQKRLLAGGSVPVMTPESERNGEVTYGKRMFPPESLTVDQRKQVFDHGHVRSDAEQIAWLKDQQQKEIERMRNPARPNLLADKRRRGLRIGKWLYCEDEIAEALAELRS